MFKVRLLLIQRIKIKHRLRDYTDTSRYKLNVSRKVYCFAAVRKQTQCSGYVYLEVQIENVQKKFIVLPLWENKTQHSYIHLELQIDHVQKNLLFCLSGKLDAYLDFSDLLFTHLLTIFNTTSFSLKFQLQFLKYK